MLFHVSGTHYIKFGEVDRFGNVVEVSGIIGIKTLILCTNNDNLWIKLIIAVTTGC